MGDWACGHGRCEADGRDGRTARQWENSQTMGEQPDNGRIAREGGEHMAELEDDSLRLQKTDKRETVESSDSDGSAQVQDGGGSLAAEVSPEVSGVVGEFMEQAAQQNEAAADDIPEVRNKPGAYISFEHVYKSFG